MKPGIRRSVLAVLLVAVAQTAMRPADALVYAEGESASRHAEPPPELGWAGACRRGGLSAVHIGEGWILTAAHVGAGSVQIADEDFAPIPESELRFNDSRGPAADLLLFRVAGAPPGRRVEIAEQPTTSGERVFLVGNGRVPAKETTWRGRRGFELGPARGLRWGQNRVVVGSHPLEIGRYLTRSFAIELDDFYRIPDEAIAASGDSGGPVFRRGTSGWRLAGILVATSQSDAQPPGTSFFDDVSFAADLSFFRDEIEAARGPAESARGCGFGFLEASLWVLAFPTRSRRQRLLAAVDRRRGRPGRHRVS